MTAALLACVLLGLGGAAAAERVVALAPLATLGNEDTSASAVAILGQLERALAALPDTTLVSAARVAQAVKRAKRPGLAVCDGEVACLIELGQLAGASVVVTGQSGGVGNARVIYLSAVDATSGRELGSTTWSTGGAGGAGGAGGTGGTGGTGGSDSAEAAVIRLLSPAAYTGTLELSLGQLEVAVYVDGAKLPPSRNHAYTLSVGTHALRINHPESRDFVRFVDISYGETTKVQVALQPLPVVQSDVEAQRRGAGAGWSRSWQRRWWVVAGGAVAIALIAGTVAYYQVHDFAPDVTLP